MEDEEAAERIKTFLKANGYPVRKSDITQILNQMTQALERQIEQGNGFGERPLLCEVIRFSKEIKVITEIAGAFKEHININIQDKELEIDAQSETRRYYEIVLLPAESANKVLKSTFSNGTLELTFKGKNIKSRDRPA
jgi:HSP20 family molecular chaperone IbpA